MHKIMNALGYICLVGNALLVPAMLLVGNYWGAGLAAVQVAALWYMLRD